MRDASWRLVQPHAVIWSENQSVLSGKRVVPTSRMTVRICPHQIGPNSAGNGCSVPSIEENGYSGLIEGGPKRRGMLSMWTSSGDFCRGSEYENITCIYRLPNPVVLTSNFIFLCLFLIFECIAIKCFFCSHCSFRGRQFIYCRYMKLQFLTESYQAKRAVCSITFLFDNIALHSLFDFNRLPGSRVCSSCQKLSDDGAF